MLLPSFPPSGWRGSCLSRSTAGSPIHQSSSWEARLCASTFQQAGCNFMSVRQGRRSSHPKRTLPRPAPQTYPEKLIKHSPCCPSWWQSAPASLVAPVLLPRLLFFEQQYGWNLPAFFSEPIIWFQSTVWYFGSTFHYSLVNLNENLKRIQR